MHQFAGLASNVFNSLWLQFEDAHSRTHQAVLASFVLVGALLAGWGIYLLVFRVILRRKVRGEHHTVLYRYRKPACWLFLISAAMLSVPAFPVTPPVQASIEHGLHIGFLLVIGWVLVVTVYVFEDRLLRRYDMSAANNLHARRARTQMAVMRRLALGFVFVVIAGLILYTFHTTRVWQYGAGLIASAGLASLALATAAKSTVSNLLAGIQIALTEPIRLDDVVIVEGQWGKVEEITAAYVVIKIWNLERLIVPLTYFIEKPFQNWTRTAADLMGTFYIYVDYTCPVAPLREEFTRVLKSTELWDGKVNVLQVTDLFKTTMQLRALLSAEDSGRLWDLRCYAREKMIDFIQRNFPQHLPTLRFAERSGVAEGGPAHEHLLVDPSHSEVA